MAHTGAVLEVLCLCLSSMFVFDVCLPDHYIAGRVVYGFEVLPFGSGCVALFLFFLVEYASHRGQILKWNALKKIWHVLRLTVINRFLWGLQAVIIHICFISARRKLCPVDPPVMETKTETLKFHTQLTLKIRDMYAHKLWNVNAISFWVHQQIEIMNECSATKCSMFNWWCVIEFSCALKWDLAKHFRDFAQAQFIFFNQLWSRN